MKPEFDRGPQVGGLASTDTSISAASGSVTRVLLSYVRHRGHDYGPWRGLNVSYECVRCKHRVPPGMAPVEQPECLEIKE